MIGLRGSMRISAVGEVAESYQCNCTGASTAVKCILGEATCSWGGGEVRAYVSVRVITEAWSYPSDLRPISASVDWSDFKTSGLTLKRTFCTATGLSTAGGDLTEG